MMKTIIVLVLFSVNTFAASNAIQKLESLSLHEYYCHIYGNFRNSNDEGNLIYFTSAHSIFANNESEVIKLCLLRIEAGTFMDKDGIQLMGKIPSLSKNAVKVEKIEIIKGQM